MTPEVSAILARRSQLGEVMHAAAKLVRECPTKTGKARQMLINDLFAAEDAVDACTMELAQQLAREGDPDGAAMIRKLAETARAFYARYHRLRGQRDLRKSMQGQLLDEDKGHFDAA